MKPILVLGSALLVSACVIVTASPQGQSLDIGGAGTEVEIGQFNSIELRGGGELDIEYSESFSFTDTGKSGDWDVRMDGDKLVLACDSPCNWRGDRSAKVTLPTLENLSLNGGGEIDISGPFHGSDEMNIAIKGGGDIDIRDDVADVDELNIAIMGGGAVNAFAVPADEVNVSLTGGGEILVTAHDELNVSIIGGGEIRYRGNPEVSRSILGGGTVRPAS